MALRSLSLCAGIGGIDLGLRQWCRTVGYVEREAFAASALVARMEDSSLDRAPIWDDLTTFDGAAWRGAVDLVTGGYPCQPFSVAGRRAGVNDPRHLWPHVARIIRECGPSLVFLENVSGHVSLGLPEVLAEVSSLGFDAEWGCFRASDVGAPHRRERLFVLAYRDEHGREELRRCGVLDGERTALWHDADGRGSRMADADDLRHERSGRARDGSARPEDDGGAVGDARGPRLEERRPRAIPRAFPAPWPPGPSDRDGWERWVREGGPQPVIRRGADGLPAFVDRADRLRALGNAVVPACAAAAFQELSRRILCS